MNLDIRESPPDGSPMVLVPEGEFLMGLPDNDLLAEEHEKPERRVFLTRFWMDLYPVTNARYALFMEAGGYQDSKCWSAEGWTWRSSLSLVEPLQWRQAGWDGPDQPVAGVSWYEADAYARWAARRLPTDAEWEKAARGTDGRHYPWGQEWPRADLANFDMQVGRTTPVGLYADGASACGCFDMAGNVNNWTSDWYWPEFGRICSALGLLQNPQLHDQLRLHLGPEKIVEKVDRGGGFATPRENHEVLSCTRKVHWLPTAREAWNGFRTAASASA